MSRVILDMLMLAKMSISFGKQPSSSKRGVLEASVECTRHDAIAFN